MCVRGRMEPLLLLRSPAIIAKYSAGRSVFVPASCLHASVKTGLCPTWPRWLLRSLLVEKAGGGNPDRAQSNSTLTFVVTAADCSLLQQPTGEKKTKIEQTCALY